MKFKINPMKQCLLIITVLVLITSCSTYDKIACPDFSNNRSYSKKYITNKDVKRALHKKHTPARDNYYAFRIYNQPKFKTRDSRDYTINQAKTYVPESSQPWVLRSHQ